MTYLSEITCTGALAKNYAWNDYVAADENSNIKFEMLLSLTCANNETLLRNYLEGSLKEETLKSEEIGPIITAVANSGIGLDLVIAFLTENMKTLYDR